VGTHSILTPSEQRLENRVRRVRPAHVSPATPARIDVRALVDVLEQDHVLAGRYVKAFASAIEHDPALSARIARVVAPAVLAQLATALGAAGEPYSTRRGHEPPGWSADRWKELAPTIPGAHRPPGARWWIVPIRSYDEWVARQTEPATPSPVRASGRPWHPSMAAEAMGWRRAGGER
jgi:hypothetical protein